MKTQAEALYIFDGLSDKEIAYFIMMSETVFVKKWQVIMSEWDESDDRAYFIESGSVDVMRWGNKIATIESGDIFGELALITSEPRTATITAAEDCELMVFAKDEFLMLYKRSDLSTKIREKILARVKENFYADK